MARRSRQQLALALIKRSCRRWSYLQSRHSFHTARWRAAGREKKRWLCLCPPRSHRNGDEGLDGILSYERARSSTCVGPFFLILPCGTSGTSHTTLTRWPHHKWARQTCLDWVCFLQHHSDLVCSPALLAGCLASLFKVFLLAANAKDQLWTSTGRKCFVFGEAAAVETPKPASALTCSLGFLIINHEASGQRAERWWKVDGQSSQTHGVFLSTSVIWCSISQASLC